LRKTRFCTCILATHRQKDEQTAGQNQCVKALALAVASGALKIFAIPIF